MNFTYRLIRPVEEATAVAFWSEMFAHDYDEMDQEYWGVTSSGTENRSKGFRA
jgi:hypothetical protein